MRNSELTADVTRPHSLVSQLHNPGSDNVWKRAAIDKEAAELVDSAMTWKQCYFVNILKNCWLKATLCCHHHQHKKPPGARPR